MIYKNSNKHLEGVKKVIDTTQFSDAEGIVDRALDVTVSDDDKIVKNSKITYRCKKISNKTGRWRK